MTEAGSQSGLKEYSQLVSEHTALYAQFPPELFPAQLIQVDNLGTDITFYNPSSPFYLNGEMRQFFRVEPMGCEGSVVCPYTLEEGIYTPVHELGRLPPLEDPTVVNIKGKKILIGVKVWNPVRDKPSETNYCNVFYEIIGDCDDYRPIAVGPERMKGTKLIDLGADGIGVMTRPHLDGDFRGVLAFQRIDSIVELTPKNLSMGRIIAKQVPAGNWVGVNDMYLLPNGRIGVLGHVAYEDKENKKHYAAMVFEYDWRNHLATPIRVIATADDYPPFESKTSYHDKVIYPCALVFDSRNPFATLLASLGDAQYARKRIMNPWYDLRSPAELSIQRAVTA